MKEDRGATGACVNATSSIYLLAPGCRHTTLKMEDHLHSENSAYTITNHSCLAKTSKAHVFVNVPEAAQVQPHLRRTSQLTYLQSLWRPEVTLNLLLPPTVEKLSLSTAFITHGCLPPLTEGDSHKNLQTSKKPNPQDMCVVRTGRPTLQAARVNCSYHH